MSCSAVASPSHHHRSQRQLPQPIQLTKNPSPTPDLKSPGNRIDNSFIPDFNQLSPHHFEKIRLLGRGDVGKVYLVHLKGYPINCQLYAMKVLEKEDMIERKKVNRCLTEREILAMTHHPFIVPMYASFQDEDKLYIIMEYCAGGEFFRVLQKQPHQCLSETAVRAYAAEVLVALEYLHQIGVVYRDLKPENILLHQNGHIRLTDFDLSKQTFTPHLDEPVKGKRHFFPIFTKKQHKRVQQFNSFVGTAEYIAPEVITGEGYGPTVDWWTLGILMYEMLYARTPFRGETQEETFNRILHQKLVIPPVNCYGPVSKPCRDLIKRLLNVDTNKRLGHKHGALDIKLHPFFKGVKWDTVHLRPPAIIQNNQDMMDFSNFQQDLVDSDEEEDDNATTMILDEKKLREIHYKTKLFGSFVYTPKTPTDSALRAAYQ